MAAKHLGHDPYELRHIGRSDLPPHPRPAAYRALLYAMALWVEEREIDTQELAFTRVLAKAFAPDPKKPKKSPRTRPKR